jgi:hypothetical protein
MAGRHSFIPSFQTKSLGAKLPDEAKRFSSVEVTGPNFTPFLA